MPRARRLGPNFTDDSRLNVHARAICLTTRVAALTLHEALLVAMSRLTLAAVATGHRESCDIITTVQGAYLDMRRELNELEGQ